MIYDELFDWQKKLVDEYKDRNAFGLFLDCGLGKTPLSLAFAEANECTKCMVITINSKAIEDNNIRYSWWEWATKSKTPYRITNKTSLKNCSEKDMLILNYESLFKRTKDKSKKGVVELKEEIQDFLSGCRGHNFALIIDESHKMKDLQSLQTKSIMKIYSYAKMYSKRCYVYLLSGTPFTTGYEDLYSQLKMLGCSMNKTEFIDHFCIKDNKPGLMGWQQPIIDYKNLDELYDLVHMYAVTVKSKEVLELPEQVFVNQALPESKYFKLLTQEKLPASTIAEMLKSIGEDTSEYSGSVKKDNPFFRNLDYPEFNYIADTPGALWLRARQISIGFQGNAEACIWYDRTRLNALKRFLEQNEDNYVLFYNYTPELIELYNICDSLGYNVDVFSGEIKSMIFYDKYCKMSESQKLTNKKNIILANFASGSTGKNWQEYSKCIIFSIPLYKDWEQGLKRVHRIGQDETVIYYIFFQYNWLDMGMKTALEKKIEYSEEMFKDGLRKEELK